MTELLALAKNPLPFIRRQFLFLLSFAVSTGLVYLMAVGWWAIMRAMTGAWFTPLTFLLSAPAFIYALGYTTANLKSLQIWLYIRRDQP